MWAGQILQFRPCIKKSMHNLTQAEKKITVESLENYFHSKWQFFSPMTILSEDSCHFVNLTKGFLTEEAYSPDGLRTRKLGHN